MKLKYKVKDFLGYPNEEKFDDWFFLLKGNRKFYKSYAERLVSIDYKGLNIVINQWRAASSWGSHSGDVSEILKTEVHGQVLGELYVAEIIPNETGMILKCTENEWVN